MAAEFRYIDGGLETLDPELKFVYVDRDGKLSINDSTYEDNKRRLADVNDSYKDNLLASLYSQVEFLRSELQEKNILIRALLIRGLTNFGLSRGLLDEHLSPPMDEHRDVDWETTLSDSGLSTDSNISKSFKNGTKDLTRDIFSTGTINEVDILQKYLVNQLNDIKQLKQKLYNDIDIADADNTCETLDVIPENDKIEPTPKRKIAVSKCSKKKKNENGNQTTNNKVETEPVQVDNHSCDDGIWENGTHLIIGDNSILGIDEKRMGKKVKVRGFPGAVIKDFYAHLTPLLQHKPSFVTLMTCFNDTLHNEPDKILKDLLKVKKYVENHVPECKVTISCPEARFGDEKIRETTIKLRKRLHDLHILQF